MQQIVISHRKVILYMDFYTYITVYEENLLSLIGIFKVHIYKTNKKMASQHKD